MKATVEEILAEFFAAAAVNQQRLKCECSAPIPGVFDMMEMTTCQRCEKMLSKLRLAEATWRS